MFNVFEWIGILFGIIVFGVISFVLVLMCGELWKVFREDANKEKKS